MLRFLHIQKTAGNSLVCGLQDEYGKDRVYNANIDMRDGGAELVVRVAHEIDAAVVYFHGDFEAMPFFEPEDTFVFFRDPVERVLSNFNHYRRGGGRRKFAEFVLFNANFQSRMVKGLDLDRVFVGLTDQFEESLRRFNERFGTKLRQHTVNVNPLKKFGERYEPTDVELRWIERCNEHDTALYARVKDRFADACVESDTAPRFSRPGTMDRQIFQDVIAGEYGPIDFKGKRVFDVGAHIGGFSCLAAAKGAVDVQAFEPGLSNFKVLMKNAIGYPAVHPLPLAMWRSDRSEPLGWAASTDPTNTGGAGTAPMRDGLTPVRAVGLDDAIVTYGLPDILKLDCEGAEYEIVPSSERLFEIPLIVGEYHPPVHKSAKLFDHLRALGFQLEVRPTVDGFGKFTARRSDP